MHSRSFPALLVKARCGKVSKGREAALCLRIIASIVAASIGHDPHRRHPEKMMMMSMMRAKDEGGGTDSLLTPSIPRFSSVHSGCWLAVQSTREDPLTFYNRVTLLFINNNNNLQQFTIQSLLLDGDLSSHRSIDLPYIYRRDLNENDATFYDFLIVPE